MKNKFIHTYVSVDCVIFRFSNDQLQLLLVQKDNHNTIDVKLPGSLIYEDEDVDLANNRVLYELTGLKNMKMKQFKCFASPERTSHEADRKWLSKEYQLGIDRLITVAYLSIYKDNKKFNNISKYKSIVWRPINKVPRLPFDHNEIVKESLCEIRSWIEYDPSIIFELLPNKFVLSQMHRLYESIYDKAIDIRNFHKKVAAMPYVEKTDELQKNVAHRAANYYRFVKKNYNKTKNKL